MSTLVFQISLKNIYVIHVQMLTDTISEQSNKGNRNVIYMRLVAQTIILNLLDLGLY